MEISQAKRYGAIDGLRSIACIGIVLMHIKSNNQYQINGFIYEKMISSFTNFVFLFMTISAFGMCCGYFEKVMSGKVDFTDFYKKRYLKILPFFSFLVLIDLLMNFSKESLYESIADISLTFGLFPNSISVIGVGWFLGLIFAFYMIFPFYCVLIEKKSRAWIMFAISLVLNYVDAIYFELGRTNIVYSMCFFLIGGLIYLYREQLSSLKTYVILPILILSIIVYYLLNGTIYACLLISAVMLIFALTKAGSIIENKLTKFISSISMEIYLSHMIIFRIIEKIGFNKRFGNGIVQYMITVSLVLSGTILFSYVINRLISFTEVKISHRLAERKGNLV